MRRAHLFRRWTNIRVVLRLTVSGLSCMFCWAGLVIVVAWKSKKNDIGVRHQWSHSTRGCASGDGQHNYRTEVR